MLRFIFLSASIVTLGTCNALSSPAVAWGACDPSLIPDTSLSCALFNVPLDYDNPSVGDARLAIIKTNATAERCGTVFFNPGGPGESGVTALYALKEILLNRTGGVYDIVSWDPRGVGLTTPGDITCFDSTTEYNTLFNGTIELSGIEETDNFADPTDVRVLFSQASVMQEKYAEVGRRCANKNGDTLKYLGTAAAVRDMISLVDALDGPNATVNYIGVSYGTLIGSWFVNMFPERVGRVILDGVYDPVLFATLQPYENIPHWLVSADIVYGGLLTGCALAGPNGCAAASEGDKPQDVHAKMEAVIKAAHDATRMNASVPLTSAEIRGSIAAQLYIPGNWSLFINDTYPQDVRIVEEQQSDQNVNAIRTRRSHPRELLPRHPLIGRQAADNGPSYSMQAITCGDSIDATPRGNTMTHIFETVVDQTRNVSHITGSVEPLFQNLCPWWPVRAVERFKGPFDSKLANKILIASNKYDPVTPLSAAQRLTTLLGEDASLLIQDGFGHSTIAMPSSCTVAIQASYMVNGTLPANNTVCEVDAGYEVFSGVDTAQIVANLRDSGF